MKNSSDHTKMNLRKLWPTISEELYPDTRKHLDDSLKEVRKFADENQDCEYHGELVSTLEKMQVLFSQHFELLGETANSRLKAHPFGAEKYPLGFFLRSCESLKISVAELKAVTLKVRSLARACFEKSKKSAQEKLILAKLNSAEQELYYLMFIELQYLVPQILREPAA